MGETHKHHYVVIMAGGSGTRLWPLSRRDVPKQFIPLLGGKSTFEHVHELVSRVFPKERILYSVTAEFKNQITALIPDIPENQIIVEPEGRDTGAAMCLVASTLALRDPEAVVTVVGADHVVETPDVFRESLVAALGVAERHPDAMVLVGTKPLRPHTGLGYIRLGAQVEPGVFAVADFEEKPSSTTAEAYVARGKHVWNTGYKAFVCAAFLERVSAIAPQIHRACSLVSADPSVESARAAFLSLEKKSFEYLFGSRLPFLVLRSNLVWHDIGDWKTVHGLKVKEGERSAKAVLVDAENSVVIGGKRVVAVYGVEDIVVVDTDDALLIVDRNRARNIKGIIEELKKRGLHDYL